MLSLSLLLLAAAPAVGSLTAAAAALLLRCHDCPVPVKLSDAVSLARSRRVVERSPYSTVSSHNKYHNIKETNKKRIRSEASRASRLRGFANFEKRNNETANRGTSDNIQANKKRDIGEKREEKKRYRSTKFSVHTSIRDWDYEKRKRIRKKRRKERQDLHSSIIHPTHTEPTSTTH